MLVQTPRFVLSTGLFEVEHANFGANYGSCGANVLILGSFPGPFLDRFSRRAVEEKFDADAGVLVAAHCVVGVRKMAAAALKGLKTGRKDERFIVWVRRGLATVMLMARGECCGLEMFPAKHARAELSRSYGLWLPRDFSIQLCFELLGQLVIDAVTS